MEETIQPTSGPGPLHRHDIPPEVLISDGSFFIETDKILKRDGTGPYQFTRLRDDSSTEPAPGYLSAIKIIRLEDGAILYQNFSAGTATLEISLIQNQSDAGLVTIAQAGSSVLINSTVDLPGTPLDPAAHRRKYKLTHANSATRISQIIVKQGTDPIYKSPLYSLTNPFDKYRVLLVVEDHA